MGIESVPIAHAIASLGVWAGSLTCVADTSVVNLDTDLVSLGRSDLDVLDAQLLASLPGDGGLAGDGLVVS